MNLKFELNWHTLAQIAAGVVQIANVATSVIPDKYKPVVATIVGIAQWYLHVYANNAPAPGAGSSS